MLTGELTTHPCCRAGPGLLVTASCTCTLRRSAKPPSRHVASAQEDCVEWVSMSCCAHILELCFSLSCVVIILVCRSRDFELCAKVMLIAASSGHIFNVWVDMRYQHNRCRVGVGVLQNWLYSPRYLNKVADILWSLDNFCYSLCFVFNWHPSSCLCLEWDAIKRY